MANKSQLVRLIDGNQIKLRTQNGAYKLLGRLENGVVEYAKGARESVDRSPNKERILAAIDALSTKGRTTAIQVRLTSQEVDALKAGMAEARCFNQSEFIRAAIAEKVARK